jgi:tRNA-2-methylthio-N6-dimethylallyladenosine synthase
MPNQLDKSVVQERYERLMAHVNNIAWQENQAQIGKTVEVLVANDEGRKDEATNRITGRAKDSRLVHISLPVGFEVPRPGDIVTACVTEAGPYHLIADVTDASSASMRRTRAGDAWDLAQALSCGVPADASASGKTPVGLGIPSLRRNVY